MFQCAEREIPPGPINTFPGWKALGRYVRRGETAITLCQPVSAKRRGTKTIDTDHGPEEVDDEHTFTPLHLSPESGSC